MTAHAHAGKSLIEIIWEELDTVLDRLISDGEPGVDLCDVTEEDMKAYTQWGEERGQAQGLAYALAVLTNPYQIDVDAIRAQAMERWREKNE